MVLEVNTPKKFDIEGTEYNSKELSSHGILILRNLTYAEVKIREMINKKAIMTKARNAYISEIKKEIIKSKSGIDLSSLLSD